MLLRDVDISNLSFHEIVVIMRNTNDKQIVNNILRQMIPNVYFNWDIQVKRRNKYMVSTVDTIYYKRRIKCA